MEKVLENIVKHPIAIAILLVSTANGVASIINAVKGKAD